MRNRLLPLVCLALLTTPPVPAQDLPPVQAADSAGEERMHSDFGLIPEPPLELEPVEVTLTDGPLDVRLAVGIERLIRFDQPFELGLEKSVAPHVDVEEYGTYVLLTGHRALSTRARVRLADGRTLPLDLHWIRHAGPAGALHIVTRTESKEPAPSVPAEALALTSQTKTPSYVQLARFAAQQVAAPERYREDLPGLTESPVPSGPVRLIRGLRMSSTPLAGWEAAGLHLTLVRVQSQYEHTPVRLDPRSLVGHWRAASFLQRRLAPGDSTNLVLISDRPFVEALGIHAVAEMPDPAPVPDGGEH